MVAELMPSCIAWILDGFDRTNIAWTISNAEPARSAQIPAHTRLRQTRGETFVTVELDAHFFSEQWLLRGIFQRIEVTLDWFEPQESSSSPLAADIRQSLQPLAESKKCDEEQFRPNVRLVANLELSPWAQDVLCSEEIEIIDQLCELSAKAPLDFR